VESGDARVDQPLPLPGTARAAAARLGAGRPPGGFTLG
jgi:hypothetical protein